MKMITVKYQNMRDVFREIFVQEGLAPSRADVCAGILADNTLAGVHSHGVNRFIPFVENLRRGLMDKNAVPEKVSSFSAFEQWDGNGGIGPLNAIEMMNRAMELAGQYGVGLVALRNTNHWMRGATYAYHAVSKGFACICWTNTQANMTPWLTSTEAIGNNPIVLGMPGQKTPAVLDMALSQYSYGKLETLAAKGELLAFDGGVDNEGRPTKDPAALLKNRQVLPVGLWKGSGLSILGDLFVSVLSHGISTLDMPESGPKICQIFLAIRPSEKDESEWQRSYTDRVLSELKRVCSENGDKVSYPGEGTAARTAENMRGGIPVPEETWNAILTFL